MTPDALFGSDVSVVINVYNEEPAFLLDAIASVKTQSHAASEIIAVDDGGPRDYGAVWARHPDVRVIRQANQGLAAARNTGLESARGTFIVFLDGDDRLLPGALAATLRGVCESPEAALVYGAWRFIDGAGRPQPRTVMQPLGSDAYSTLLQGNCIGMHAAVLYRRDVLARIGGFNASCHVCEDYELYLRLARQSVVRAVPEMVAEYRQHDANISADNARMLAGVLQVLAMQDESVGGRDDWRKARACGVAGWVRYYTERFLSDERRSGVRVRRAAAAQQWARLCRLAPAAVVGVTIRQLSMAIRAWFTRGSVSFGDLRRTNPVSTQFGFDRGRPVDRYYIEAFLQANADDIGGRVLEVGDDTYTRRFGSTRVTAAEVLHISSRATGATYCTDLTEGAGLPDGHFDCVILTQTLHLIFDIDAAIRTLRRIVAPGGSLLVTVPGVSSIDRGEWHDTWYWSFTPASLERALSSQFGASAVTIGVHGNVLSATAFLYGLADHELSRPELDAVDPHYPVIVTARVRTQVEGRG